MLLKTVFFAFLATAVHAGPVDYMKESVVTRCYANNATDKVEEVKILMDEYTDCSPKIVYFQQLMVELNEAQNGAVDELTRNYCAKNAQTKTCFEKLYRAEALCAIIGQEDMFINDVWDRIFHYICYEENGKTRLAKFVDDGGIRCYMSRGENISRCPSRLVATSAMAALEETSRCLIDELKTCSNAAAIRMQVMFDTILNERPSSSNNQLHL